HRIGWGPDQDHQGHTGGPIATGPPLTPHAGRGSLSRGREVARPNDGGDRGGLVSKRTGRAGIAACLALGVVASVVGVARASERPVPPRQPRAAYVPTHVLVGFRPGT